MLRISRRAGSYPAGNEQSGLKRFEPNEALILQLYPLKLYYVAWVLEFESITSNIVGTDPPRRNPKAPHVAFGSVEVSKQDCTLTVPLTELRFVRDFVMVVGCCQIVIPFLVPICSNIYNFMRLSCGSSL